MITLILTLLISHASAPQIEACITQEALDAEYAVSGGYEITAEEFCHE